MTRAVEWPPREEWAKQRRTCYIDLLPDISDRIADYATPDEIAALTTAMRERWKELGRDLRQLGGSESDKAYELRHKRRSINHGLKLVKSGALPIMLENYFGAQDILADLHKRCEAAKAEAYERRAREIAQTPTDDAAWSAELERRAKIDSYLTQRSA